MSEERKHIPTSRVPIQGQKFFGRILLCLLFVCLTLAPIKSNARRVESNIIANKYAAYVVDADTGQVLHNSNAHKKLHPASLTKLMTLLMVFDAVERGNLKLYNRMYVSRHAASMPPSKLNLPAGSTIKVEDAILILVTKSANDIAVTIAEKLGGTEDEFAHMMTRKARSLGMRNTLFRNASGLHDPKQISTAHDMSILARVLLTEYKDYYHYFSTRSFSYDGKTYRNHNKLMSSYNGMDGMKTGYIKASGFNLIASAVRQDHRLIGVVFGGRTGRSRDTHMERLLDSAFNQVGGVYILASEVPVPGRKPQQNYNDNLVMASLSVSDTASKASAEPDLTSSDLALSPQEGSNSDADRDYAAAEDHDSRWNMLDSSKKDSMFNRMIGEGDYDINVKNRIETGLIAISAQLRNSRKEKISATPNKKNEDDLASVPAIPSSSSPSVISGFAERGGVILESSHETTEIANIEPSAPSPDASKRSINEKWSIQVGAFTSRNRTEKALSKTLNMLPDSLSSAKSRVAPLKTKQGWIYRARFDGYSETAAKDACALLPDCIALAPIDN